MKPYIILSGGFDPLHVGHLDMIKDASYYGEVIIILNNDVWLMKKKGYVFMPENERKEILEGLKYVNKVIISGHKLKYDRHDVVSELSRIVSNYRYMYPYAPLCFGNGGDRIATNTPEVEYCMENNIQLLFNLGGLKKQSSSELVKQAEANKNGKTKR